MTYIRLSDKEWTKIREFLVQEPNVYLGKEADCRLFLDAVLWISRTGAQWRALPKEYGNWNSVYKRFARWSERGVWQRMMAAMTGDADMENGMIDSTIVCAHPCAAGAQKKSGASLGMQSRRL